MDALASSVGCCLACYESMPILLPLPPPHAFADMIRFFKQHDLHTILVPDVRAAAAGQLTSAVGAQRGIKQSTNEVRCHRTCCALLCLY